MDTSSLQYEDFYLPNKLRLDNSAMYNTCIYVSKENDEIIENVGFCWSKFFWKKNKSLAS